jgi:hypothetical protein
MGWIGRRQRVSEGDGYRDYDPKERVVELQHEVADLKRELEEERAPKMASPTHRAVVPLPEKKTIAATAPDGRRNAPSDRREDLAWQRENVVWQLLAQWIVLSINAVVAAIAFVAGWSWGAWLLATVLLFGALVAASHWRLRGIEHRIRALDAQPRMRVGDVLRLRAAQGRSRGSRADAEDVATEGDDVRAEKKNARR